jgi:hypothetical protein
MTPHKTLASNENLAKHIVVLSLKIKKLHLLRLIERHTTDHIMYVYIFKPMVEHKKAC